DRARALRGQPRVGPTGCAAKGPPTRAIDCAVAFDWWCTGRIGAGYRGSNRDGDARLTTDTFRVCGRSESTMLQVRGPLCAKSGGGYGCRSDEPPARSAVGTRGWDRHRAGVEPWGVPFEHAT